MIKKATRLLFYLLVPAAIFVWLGFAVENNKSMPLKSFQVYVFGENGIAFMDSAFVVNQVYQVLGNLQEKKIRELPLKTIEDLINNLYYVGSSRVYRTIDGHLVAEVHQRTPLARVINNHNESFYIDRTGKLMRTSAQYSARVMVVTGHISTRYSAAISLSDDLGKEKLTTGENTLRELNKLIHYIHNNAFLQAWIDQIYVTRQGHFELIPKNGVHVVEFGSIQNMEEKFNNLLLFYRNGLTHVGWNSYSRVNLKFKNQIICSK